MEQWTRARAQLRDLEQINQGWPGAVPPHQIQQLRGAWFKRRGFEVTVRTLSGLDQVTLSSRKTT
jgi:hypothetical protein